MTVKYKMSSTPLISNLMNWNQDLQSSEFKWASNQSFIKHWSRSEVKFKYWRWHSWSMFYEDILHKTLISLCEDKQNFIMVNIVVSSITFQIQPFPQKKNTLLQSFITFVNSISWLIPKSRFNLRQTHIPNIFPFIFVCRK